VSAYRPGSLLRRLLTAGTPPILLRLLERPQARVYERPQSAGVDWFAYQDPRIVEVVAQKTAAYRRELENKDTRTVEARQVAQDMFVVAHVSAQKAVSVLELGGACGASYFEQAWLQPQRVKAWSVVETPPMAAAGRRAFADERLTFSSDVGEAVARIAERNLLLAKGVLQYLPDPLGTLDELFRLSFDHVYVTRTEISAGLDRPVVLVRTVDLALHGPGSIPAGFRNGVSSVPTTIVPQASLLARIPTGYRVAYVFDEGAHGWIRVGGRKVETRMVGFLADKTG